MVLMMSNLKFSDDDLNLMSYQELRRLSILLRLPANIKKKYMISMIQAHQKGDGCTKTAIANKVMEERKVKRMSAKGRQGKPFIMVSTTATQQIPTDLSVSTKHEFETRFSYVAHYTSKDNTNSGISQIIKEETEVSRRNRNILQQPRKPNRKLSTIMLPRNHSLTTPVRLMPQYERGFAPPSQYENVPAISNPKSHYQDSGSYNYQFHGEYSNSLMPSSSHELYRNESYWHPREIYNNSLMPILSSLLTPSSVGPSSFSSQNTIKAQSSFQGIYEKYIKNSSLMEGQPLESNVTNSTVILNNHFAEESVSNCGDGHGNYIVTKDDVDFEMSSPLDDIGYQQCNKRDDTVIRHANDVAPYMPDVYLPRHELGGDSQVSQFGGEFFKMETTVQRLPQPDDAYRKAVVPPHKGVKMIDLEMSHHRTGSASSPPNDHLREYERDCAQEENAWSDHDNGRSKGRMDKNDLVSAETDEERNSLLSDASRNSADCLTLAGQNYVWDKKEIGENRLTAHPKCRYVLGHNKYPEALSKKSEVPTVLPSFWSTFCTFGAHNKAYSLCRNSFTGTTETHMNPIMTSGYASQYTSHVAAQVTSPTNPEENSQLTRPWLYSYPETQASYSLQNSTYSAWNEYSNDMGDKIVAHNGNHEVQVVKCRKHGCHYLYSVSNSCT